VAAATEALAAKKRRREVEDSTESGSTGLVDSDSPSTLRLDMADPLNRR
jgi:hypothetical protein